MTNDIPFERLKELDACDDAIEYLHTQPDMQTAWDTSIDGTHLAWWVSNMIDDPMLDLQIQVLMLQTPLGDGRVVEDLLTDERSLVLVAMKRRKLSGEIIWDAGWDAGWDAAGTSRWAAGAAAKDAWAAAGDARDAAGDARDAAWAAAPKWQADAIREIIPVVPMPELTNAG